MKLWGCWSFELYGTMSCYVTYSMRCLYSFLRPPSSLHERIRVHIYPKKNCEKTKGCEHLTPGERTLSGVTK